MPAPTSQRREAALIRSTGNHLSVQGLFGISDLHRLLAALHNTIVKAGYPDIKLDFSGCTATFAGPMLAVCAQVTKLRSQEVDTEIVLPREDSLQRLFVNANWANLIDPGRQGRSTFRGSSQVPVTQFTSATEQNSAVNTIIDALLSSLRAFSRPDLAAIEWAVNEITDNVINHAECSTGGLVQLTTFSKRTQRVEFAVCDAGIGIPTSLRRGLPHLTSDTDAIYHAIKEGVTRDKKVGQGNGLYGTFEICRRSGGYFEIHSGNGRLSQREPKGLDIRHEAIPYTGTLVVACIDYSKPRVLAEALAFGGKPHTPIDYIETRFESKDKERVVFVMHREAPSFGSRVAGRPVRTKLENLTDLCTEQKVFVDLSEIPMVSSSFADEVFGRLFAKLGATEFMRRFELVNANDTVRSLIDRAISQRLASGG